MGARRRADVSPEIRGGLKRALALLEEKGKPISTIWIELFEDDPATAMRLAISTLPKEIDATVEHSERPDSAIISGDDWKLVDEARKLLSASNTIN